MDPGTEHTTGHLNVFVLDQQLGEAPSRETFRAAQVNASSTQCSGSGTAEDYVLVPAPERLSYPIDHSALVFIESDIFISGYERLADQLSAEVDKAGGHESAADKAIKKTIRTLYDIYLSNVTISACQGMKALRRLLPAEDILTVSQRNQILTKSWMEFESIITKNFFAKTNLRINVEAITAGAGPEMVALRSTLRKRFVEVCQLAYAMQDSPAAGSSDSWSSFKATKAAFDQYLRGESSLLGDDVPCPAELPLHPHAVHSMDHGNDSVEQESSGDEGSSDDEQDPLTSWQYPKRRGYTESQASEASHEEEDGAGADDEDMEGGGEDIEHSDGEETESEDDDGDVEMADFVVADEDMSEEEDEES